MVEAARSPGPQPRRHGPLTRPPSRGRYPMPGAPRRNPARLLRTMDPSERVAAMLVKLFGENFGPFKEPFELSMEAMDLPTEGERGYFEVPIEGQDKPLKLLRLAAIYGPNASGKSTIIKAARALEAMVVDSASDFKPGRPIPVYRPFALARSMTKAPSTLGAEVVVGNRIMQYTVSFTGSAVVGERIADVSDEVDKVWLQREGQDIRIDASHLQGLTIDLKEVTRKNAAALSMAALNNQTALAPLHKALDMALCAVSADTRGALGYSLGRIHDDEAVKRWAMDRFITRADIGIIDIETELRDVPDDFFAERGMTREEAAEKFGDDTMHMVRAQFKHRGADDDFELDWREESEGTLKMLALAGPWYEVTHLGLTVFVDEMTASLHEDLVTALLEAFNAPPSERASQMIFTTHDTTPMERVLRRDQVYFTEKKADGSSVLFSLGDFKDRAEHNIRKRYLQGRYGAIPRAVTFGGLFSNGED
ncbi:MAG: ATP/GTP-binding protein [Phycisphaerales bacterium JB064]